MIFEGSRFYKTLQMTKFKNTLRTMAVLVLIYVVSWVFGAHGHSYYLEPAKQAGAEWACPEEEQGPVWENGKGRRPNCHIPVRQCPVLWFPIASQVPCPYKDPLGGPYTEDDLLALKMQHARHGR